MLPFLKRNQDAGTTVLPETIRREHDEDADVDYLESCAEEIIHAIETKNKKLLSEALRAAFEICDAEPHIEGKHE